MNSKFMKALQPKSFSCYNCRAGTGRGRIFISSLPHTTKQILSRVRAKIAYMNIVF